MDNVEILQNYRAELQQELHNILQFWMSYTFDDINGGFYGKLNNDNHVFVDAPKGSVLNGRILWTFSAAYNLTKNKHYLSVANRAYEYFTKHFIDKEFGGVFWSVDHKGKPLDTKKQVYALSFAVYGLSEYYGGSEVEEARAMAIKLYNIIVERSYDNNNGGYIEALTRDWKEIGDMRLSAKDANEKKSMNTHLHVLEGFANLYELWPDKALGYRITDLIAVFSERIIDKTTGHLILFFDEAWHPKSTTVSYGHDIEAAWLIEEAAITTGDSALTEKCKKLSLQLAVAAAEGLDKDGGLWYEYDAEQDYLIKEKHSWPQAESMIGFFNAWQITKDDLYLERSLNSWQFIKNHILDKSNGEWIWGVHENYAVMDKEKVGVWKCPYHNSRACMQLIKRINRVQGVI